jgi:zinc protease
VFRIPSNLIEATPMFTFQPVTLRSAALMIAAVTILPDALPAQRRPAAPPARATLVGTVEGISEYRLANGLRIILFPDQARPSTTVNITYLVGSRHESYGESGMAHLLEHLLFKGTPRHPNIPQELTERGGRANGTTWYDRTNYFITFPANDANLEWAIRLEADRMVNSYVRRQDLETEFTVVRNEFESGENNPFRVLSERVLSSAYLWHGYGRSTIGSRADIENVPIERLQAFYRRWYQPDNALIAVSGRFDEQATLRLLERHFGAIPRPNRTGEMRLWETYTREPVQDGERSVTVRRVGDVQYVLVSYHVPSGAHEEFAAVDLLAHVAGNAPSGRLYQALVETGKAAAAGAFARQLNEPGHFMAYAQVRTDQSLDTARAILIRTLDELATRAPSDEEVNRARSARLRDIQLGISNSEQVGINLTEWAATGDWRLMFIHRDRIRAATTAQVAAAASSYLRQANRTVGLFIPEAQPVRAEIPPVPDIAGLVSGYRGSETMAAGEAFDPTHANIETRTRRLDFPNGFRIALLPKQTRGGTVLANFAQRMGTESALTGRGATGSMTAGLLMRGTARRTRQQLTDEIARLESRLNVGGSATIVQGSIETTRANLVTLLRLLGEVLREPAFDEREFETLKRERLATLETQRSEPQALASVALSRHMSPRPVGHILYTETIDEAIASLQAVTLADVRNFHRDFYGAGTGGTLSVVGDFDAAEVEGLLREIFGNWQRRQPYQRVATRVQNVQPVVQRIETPDKPNAVMFAGYEFVMRDDHADYPALLLSGYMLGGGFLNSRLATRIRQREGISYGIGGSISATPIDTIGRLSGFAIYAPANVERLLTAFREEIERAARDGFTAEEIEAAKRGWMQGRDVARATDQQLVGTLQNGLFLDRTLQFDADLEARVRALTPAQINAAMRRYIDPSRISIFLAGDFARGAAAATPVP